MFVSFCLFIYILFMIPNSNSCPHSSSNIVDSSKDSEPHSPAIASRIQPNETPPTQAQIDIIRYTWERVSDTRHPGDDPNVSASHAFGLAFYEALFELDPTLKQLFTNIFQQARALAGMISYIARAPNVVGQKPCRSSTAGCGFATSGRILTIREINAKKRKDNTATTFSELVINAANSPDSVTQDEIEGDPERLLYKLRELGARHYFYNVQSHQLALVGPAILTAIKARLGKEFIPEVAEAWTRVSFL